MSTLPQKLRKHLSIRPRILALCVVVLVCFLIAPVFGAGEGSGALQYVLYDDISNSINPSPETGAIIGGDDDSDSDDGSDPASDSDSDSDPASGSDDGSDPASGNGHDNNGHGNNADGVDSSNPGQGHGGPNGGVDPSCDGTGDCIDDETGGGGASPSHGNGHGNN